MRYRIYPEITFSSNRLLTTLLFIIHKKMSEILVAILIENTLGVPSFRIFPIEIKRFYGKVGLACFSIEISKWISVLAVLFQPQALRLCGLTLARFQVLRVNSSERKHAKSLTEFYIRGFCLHPICTQYERSWNNRGVSLNSKQLNSLKLNRAVQAFLHTAVLCSVL